MKRLVCATLIPSVLALTLMGTAGASAQSYGHGGYNRGYSHGHDNTGAMIGLGIGLFALGAIVAASSHNDDRDRYDDRAYQTNYAPNGYQAQYQGGYQNGGYQNDYRGNYQNYRGNGYDYRGR